MLHWTDLLLLYSNISSPSLTLFTPTYCLTSTFPFSHRAAAWSFNLLYSPPTSHPNMSLPLPLTRLLLTSSYSITSYTAAVLKRTSPTELHYLSYITRLVFKENESTKCNATQYPPPTCMYTWWGKLIEKITTVNISLTHKGHYIILHSYLQFPPWLLPVSDLGHTSAEDCKGCINTTILGSDILLFILFF